MIAAVTELAPTLGVAAACRALGVPRPAAPPAAVWINPPRDRTTPLPAVFSPTPERAGPDRAAGAEASRRFTAQRPLDASTPAGYAVAERPVVGENQSAAP